MQKNVRLRDVRRRLEGEDGRPAFSPEDVEQLRCNEVEITGEPFDAPVVFKRPV